MLLHIAHYSQGLSLVLQHIIHYSQGLYLVLWQIPPLFLRFIPRALTHFLYLYKVYPSAFGTLLFYSLAELITLTLTTSQGPSLVPLIHYSISLSQWSDLSFHYPQGSSLVPLAQISFLHNIVLYPSFPSGVSLSLNKTPFSSIHYSQGLPLMPPTHPHFTFFLHSLISLELFIYSLFSKILFLSRV